MLDEGQLSTSIAHEVNRPIAAVLMNAGAALRWLGAQTPDLKETHDALGRIVKDAKRAGEIIDRIRALIKKVAPQKDRLDVSETILEVVALARSELLRDRVSLQTQLADDLPLVQGDRIQLQQVLRNLIVNSVEAMRGVGEARGVYLPISARGRLKQLLGNWPEQDVRFIVVTDSERILGLGDLGAGGMGIPLGKLALYTACAGVPPQYSLPVVLDVGTNNQQVLDDPLYLGLRQPRQQSEDYPASVDEFVETVQTLYPKSCIQWKDFANTNAVPILVRYRGRICTFNDDIQGTAGVALAGVFAALRVSGQKLAEQRFLFLGGGSAATGIADLISLATAQAGMDLTAARGRNALFDINGLMVSSRTDLAEFQKPFALDHPPVATFVEAVEALRPTGIIGVSTVPKPFTREVIEAMSRINDRPIIFPYSNPTSRSECTAEEAYRWSHGRAIFASGSPFPPVEIGGRRLVPGQGNNVYIFPAMGMAVYATEASRVTEEMFIVAAQAVAEQVTEENLSMGLIYPRQSRILSASLHIAERIAAFIFDQGLARVKGPDDVGALIRAGVYRPIYRELS